MVRTQDYKPMALQYNELVDAQTKNPPQYGQQGQVITVDQLQPAPDISKSLPQPKIDTTQPDSLVAGVNGSLGSLDAFMKALQPQETALDQTQNTIISRINDLLPQTAGRQQALAQEQQNQGIPDLQKQLTDLNNQINIGNAAYTKLAVDAEAKKAALEANSRGLTTNLLTGQQGAVERQAATERAVKAAELGMLAARAQAVSGNINTAIKLSEQAIEARFAPIEDELKIRQAQLEAIQPLLTKQEKQQALRQQLVIDERNRMLPEQKANEKAINEMVINASAQGAPSDVVNAAAEAQTPLEASKILGKYSGDYLKYEMLKEQIKTEKLQQTKLAADTNRVNAEIRKINNDIKNSGISPVTNPVANAFSGALNVILGSDKFTKEQKQSIINAVNSGVNPVSVIKNQAKNIMGQTEATALAKLETARNQMLAVDSAIKQYYANGGSTDIFKGNLEKTINRLGDVKDPKLVGIAVKIQTSLQAYRNAISGTAYSEQEGRDIANIFPGINKTEGLNTAIINARLEMFDSTIDSEYRNVLGSSYDEIKTYEQSLQSNPVTPTVSNPFAAALGNDQANFTGTTIVGGVNGDGTLNFTIPSGTSSSTPTSSVTPAPTPTQSQIGPDGLTPYRRYLRYGPSYKGPLPISKTPGPEDKR